jgi:hypothetical protein|nr:MAG TPA: hypothetical protein [Caudoviricetes sp.]DAQ91388.1 MAG TPA: hypothetical protein [Caudoviricetes sp.]
MNFEPYFKDSKNTDIIINIISILKIKIPLLFEWFN